MSLCSVSNKHIVCHDCCQRVCICPLCNGTLVDNISLAQSMIDTIEEVRKNLEDYCFPSDLAKEIIIKYNQEPMTYGTMGKLFYINDKYVVKCALIPNTIEIEEALIHEIALSHPLAHIPHLVSVYGGVRLAEHGIGIVMEYINGPSLAAALADNSTIIRNLSIQERLQIALGIAQGIGELHLAQIVHRDFKPENVLLSQSPNGIYIPKITDFGVSFQLSVASATFVKDSCGTAGYDAPEVVIGNERPSAASDIYVLAFTLYELLTSRRVFHSFKPAQILWKFTMCGERPSNWHDDTPNPLKQVIEQAWCIEADRRATIAQIIHSIRKALDRNQVSCLKMLQKNNYLRNKIASVQLEDFQEFELFALNEFIKRMTIDDCEAMQIFIDKLLPTS
ncbi:unnamed protein product [Rotaria sordida]|uniref:Protein kinase domain-containing protein n=1 Tax=Rotaria sordida TaxID=392033 RepID=A0A819CBN1_9BILA|nr:unnamed protein product [Rotaria sordida]